MTVTRMERPTKLLSVIINGYWASLCFNGEHLLFYKQEETVNLS
jgi:hypothetical protein